MQDDDAVRGAVEPGVELLAEGAQSLEARCQTVGPSCLPGVGLAVPTRRRQVEDLKSP